MRKLLEGVGRGALGTLLALSLIVAIVSDHPPVYSRIIVIVGVCGVCVGYMYRSLRSLRATRSLIVVPNQTNEDSSNTHDCYKARDCIRTTRPTQQRAYDEERATEHK